MSRANMKLVRFFLIAVAVAIGAGVVAGVLVFNPRVQTYVAQRGLASHPEWHTTIGRLSAGWRHVTVRDVRYEEDGAVLSVPQIEAELLVVSAALSDQVNVARLVAKGWTLDLSRQTSTPAAGGSAGRPATTTPAAVTAAFGGVFSRIQLPVDLSLEGVDLEGEVILPELRGRVKVVLRGGGLGAGREGKFEMHANAELKDPAVNAVRAAVALTATMDTPRTLARLTAKLEAEASGTKFPTGVKLNGDAAVSRAAAGESYRTAIVTADRQVLLLQASLPAGAGRLDGTWTADIRDSDLAPFALGRALPDFSLEGAGTFEADVSFVTVRVTGRLAATGNRLEAIMPRLSAMGPVSLRAEFDLARTADVLRVASLQARLDGARPIAVVRSLQAFEWGPQSSALTAAEAGRELFDLVIEGAPLGWAVPFVPELSLSGAGLKGHLVATAHDGGLSLRTKTPLTAAGVSAGWAGRALVQSVDWSLGFSLDQTPQGWQAEIESLTAAAGGTPILRLAGKAGQLRGPQQPMKATGTLRAELPALLAQPGAAGIMALTAGRLAVDFVGSVAAKNEVELKIDLRDLAVGAIGLPRLAAQVRADVAAGGQLAINAPIQIEQDGRKSDLTLIGTLTPGPEGRTIAAELACRQLYVDDVKLLAAMVPDRPAATPEGGATPAPPWTGVQGSVALQLKKVIYSDLFQISDLAGVIRLEAGSITLEGLRAGLGDGGSARLDGAVTFTRAVPGPYGMKVALVVKEFDPAPLFRALNPTQPPTVEGRFNVDSTLAARGASLSALALGAGGDFQLTSRGGTFRGLPVSAAARLEATGTLAAGIARLGSLANAISGKNDKTIENVANKAQAVAELANYWKAIPYDQLSVTLSRDAALNATLKNFTLISPEVRLSGQGQAIHRAGGSLLDDELGMEFQLRARGHHAELLRYVGVLGEPTDELGYAACTLPLKVAGTLGKPDTSELNDQLAAIALEKSGVGDRAMELFNRLRRGKQ